MYAVVKIAGQQFKVEKNQTLFVPHQEGSAGDKVEFTDVLLTDNDGQLSIGDAVKLKIQALGAYFLTSSQYSNNTGMVRTAIEKPPTPVVS